MDREKINAVLRSLRDVNLQGSLFGVNVALRFGLSETDIDAIEELLDVGAATAGELSDLTGLTTGAVTRVIDRLEQAGYARRVPDPTDRRRVIVELVPERVADVEATIARVGEKSASEIGTYSDAELGVINDFLTRMAAIRREEASALRETREPAGGGSYEHAAPIGGLRQARLLFKAGAHELLIRAAADLDDLYRARFEGGAPQVRLREGVVSIQYKGGWQWAFHERRADIALNTALPWDIEIDGGASKLQGKLTPLDLRSFRLTGGVDKFRLMLGQPAGVVPIRFSRGANNIRIERPTGVPVRLTVRGGAGRVDFDKQQVRGLGATELVQVLGGRVDDRIVRVASVGPEGTVLETVGAADDGDRYQVEIEGGAGRITITEVG
jgi:DNA-binding MarR family transcriptional regulator